MKNKVMLGLWRYIINVPPFLMRKKIAKAQKRFRAEGGFMTEEHRLVHHFVVRKIPSAGGPLSPEIVAEELDLPLDSVKVILNDLEKGMTFLVMNQNREVVWAFPVTVEKTPHHLTFNTGEQIYAA
jgi:hypothetical protein